MPEVIEFDLEPQGLIEFDLEPPQQALEFDLEPPQAAAEPQATEKPGIVEQVLAIPKVFRTVGAETGLKTAGGFEAGRARSIRQGAASPVALQGRLVGMSRMTPEERLATAIDRANTLSSQRATEASQDYLDAASAAPEEYGLDPKLETGLITQVTRGVAKGAGMYAVAAAGGIPALALQGSTEAFGAAKQHGKSDDEADKESTRALIGLALFGGANKVVASGIARYLGNASKLRTFLVQTLGQAAGNEVTSRAISAYEAALDAEPGKRLDKAVEAISKNDAATIAQNVGFALMGGMQATKNAVVSERNNIRLEEVGAENIRRAQEEKERTEQVIAEQNAQAARLGEQRVASGDVAGPAVSPEALTPEQRARAEAAPPIVTGAVVPAPQQKQEEAEPDLQAGVIRTQDGRIFEITETGPQEVVEGSPKDLSMAVLGTKEPAEATEAPKAEAQPEAVKLSPFEPKTEGEQIISTAILGEDGVPISGPDWRSGHAEIIKKNPELALIEDVDSRKGFIVQDAEGNQKFVGRKQALEIARKSGQVDEASVRSAEAEGLISEALVEPKAKEAPEVEAAAPEPVEAPPGPPPPPEAPIGDQGRPPIESPTGIRNAKVDQNRIAQGLPPRMEPLRKTFGAEWDRAMEIVDRNSDSGSALVSELTKTPRALTPTETALLSHEQVTRENAYNEALRAVNEAPNEAVRNAAETLISRARERNLEVYKAGRRAGTESGQSLAFRKMLVNRDYSLAAMETELTALKGGKNLNPKERAKVEAEAKVLHERIKSAEDRALKAEEKLAQAQSQQEFSKLIKLAKHESSAARKQGKSILDTIIDSGTKAEERIRKRNIEELKTGVQMRLLPFRLVDFPDHVLIGAKWIAQGAKTIGEFTAKLVEAFGKDSEQHAERIFNAANQYHQEAVKTGPKVRSVEEAIARDVASEPLNPEVVYEIARAHVNAGVTGHDPVISATHKTLLGNRPDLTVREVRDAFSGYGKVTRPSQAEDRVKLREYKRIGQLTSAIEDAQRKIAPMKSGPQRDKATETVRSKMAELKRVMEENGIEVTSPEQQLATAERAAVTRLTNSIESLERQIALKTRDVESKGRKPDTPEIKALRERAEELRKTLDEVAPRPDGERSEKASLNAVRKSIEELDRQIQEGDIAAKKTKTKEPSPELEALRLERDSMRQLLKDLREEGKVKRAPEEIALARYKKTIAGKTKAIEERIKKGDYVKKDRKQTELDEEGLNARFEYQKAKDAFEKKAFEYDLSRRGAVQRAYDTALEVLNTSRSIITSFDVSAPMRQGAFITLAHPIRSLKSIPKMFRAFGSEKYAFDVQESLSDPRQRPNAALYRQSGLDLTETGPNVTRRKLEEAYQSRFASKIPIVAGSQRAYTTFLNLLRADSFDAMVENLGRKGKVTEAEAKAIAKFINIATGRGQYGQKMEQSTQFLNSVFFAPKYVASRFQLLLDPLTGFSITSGVPFTKGSQNRVRKQVAKEYAKFILGAGVVIGLAKMGGADVEDDPMESDFGKIRIGNTRMDPFGGLIQSSVLMARTGATASMMFDETKEARKRRHDFPRMTGTFLRQKLSPVFSANYDALTGKDVAGNEVTPAGAYSRLVVPLSFGDIREALIEQGVPRGTALSLVSLFGVSMSTYEKGVHKPAQEPWELVREDLDRIFGAK